jgi:hypothetical protein
VLVDGATVLVLVARKIALLKWAKLRKLPWIWQEVQWEFDGCLSREIEKAQRDFSPELLFYNTVAFGSQINASAEMWK